MVMDGATVADAGIITGGDEVVATIMVGGIIAITGDLASIPSERPLRWRPFFATGRACNVASWHEAAHPGYPQFGRYQRQTGHGPKGPVRSKMTHMRHWITSHSFQFGRASALVIAFFACVLQATLDRRY
jgi:hypothetical protein